jgi:hypothetical protein
VPTIGDFTTASSISSPPVSAAAAASGVGNDRIQRWRSGSVNGWDRGGRRGHRRDGRCDTVFADFQPEAFVFDFEFREVVLSHEVEQFFDVVEVH